MSLFAVAFAYTHRCNCKGHFLNFRVSARGSPKSGPADLVPETPPADRVEQIQILPTACNAAGGKWGVQRSLSGWVGRPG